MVDGLGPCFLIGYGDGDLLILGQASVLESVIPTILRASIFVIKEGAIRCAVLDANLFLLGLGVGDGGVVDLLVPSGGYDCPDLLGLSGLGGFGAAGSRAAAGVAGVVGLGCGLVGLVRAGGLGIALVRARARAEDGFESFLLELELEPEGLDAGLESPLPDEPFAAPACWTVELLGLDTGALTVLAFGFSRLASMSFLAAARSSSGRFSIAASTAASSVMSTLVRLTLTEAPLPSTTKSTASGTSQVVLPSLAVGIEVTFRRRHPSVGRRKPPCPA